MRLSFKRGERGFTLLEIIIVLAVLAILAAVIVPNVTGFVGRGKERAWAADRDLLQVAVDAWRTDITQRAGNPWPITAGQTIGAPTEAGTADGDFADVGDLKKGIIDVAALATTTGQYLKGADVVKSASANQVGATNTIKGSYTWYIDTDGVVKSYYWSGSAWVTGFQTDIYP